MIARIRALSRPLEPLPTAIEARLPRLAQVRAVLFDIYGTLFVSAAGEIGVGLAVDSDQAFAEALAAVGLPPRGSSALLTAAIQAEHARKRAAGIDYPEVDIIAIWQAVLAELGLQAPLEMARRLALEYELRVNPVWPMPDLAETLAWLAGRGYLMGIVSNAQFFTPLLFPALVGKSLEELGFLPELCLFSWRLGVAKPSTRPFEAALTALVRHGVGAGEVLYVGNDIRNDIRPSVQVGMAGGLYAGDARSLRLREDDPGCRDVEPTCIFKTLSQIPAVLGDSRLGIGGAIG
ncbi:HAD family hydrolase [Methylomarinovum tepidoasis]|uniref:HAD family hydrolase n=1 Tax=Methylomarinovum tepidoasis TaxID=2840183 RepID=UPI002573CD48|nr:HAD family hydrolase [Methylomarinovum sp. IN45]